MKKIITILLLTLMVFSLTGCGNKKTKELKKQVNQLTNENASLKAENEELRLQLSEANTKVSTLSQIMSGVNTDQSKNFICFVFPTDGILRKAHDGLQWYKSPYCSPDDIITAETFIVSPKVVEIPLFDSFHPYACMNSHGEIVYSPDYPSLSEVKK